MKIRKAVIAAAGWGTRFLPVTKAVPKEMLPLLNKPIIQYSVEEAVACGIELVVIVTAQGKRAIEDYFDRSLELEQVLKQKGESQTLKEVRRLSDMVDICYVRQKAQLGLGHAVLAARNMVGNEPFVLLLPDDLFEQHELVLKRMIEVYENHRSSVVAVKRVPPEEVGRYGVVEPRKVAERIHEVMSLVEKPRPEESPSNLAIMGRYVLMPEVFEALESTSPGRDQEIQLTDGLQHLLEQHPIYAYEFDGERYDVGTPLGWLQTMIALALKTPDMGPKLRDYLSDLLGLVPYSGGDNVTT